VKVHTITGPDGTVHRIEGPENATREQVIAKIKERLAAKQQAPQEVTPEQQRAEIGRQELGNPLQAGLIGAGRFVDEMAGGIKQKALMAGEGLGLVDEGRADEYTQQLMQERQRWDELTSGAGPEDVGYYGAMMAPGLLAPGAGIAGTAAMGALEAGAMPTEQADWGETAQQAGLGGATAGLFRAAPDVYQAAKGARQASKLGKMDPDAIALAERGVMMSPDVYAPGMAKNAAREITDIPIVSDFLRGKPMRADAERVMREMVDATSTDKNIQSAFVEGTERMRKADSAAWSTMFNEPVLPGTESIRIGELPVDQNSLINRLMQTAETPKEQKALMELGQYVPLNQIENMDLKGLHQFRANFAANQNWGDAGLSKATQKKIYAAMTKEMEDVAGRGGGERALNMLNDKIAQSRDGVYRTLKSSRVMKAAQNDLLDSESTFVRAALGNDKDKLQSMKTILGTEGADSVRNEIANDILSTYLEKGPRAGSGRINKLGDSIETFFGPDDAAMYRGLGKFLDNIPARNSRDLTSAAVTGAVGTGLGAATGGAVVPALTIGALSTAMRRRDVQAMLRKLSKEPADSKLAQALSSSIGLALSGENADAEPLQIQIQNGRTP
jgi:hypothetical protein